ncbi:MAG: ribonuclease HII [Bacteroidia bacterium]
MSAGKRLALRNRYQTTLLEAGCDEAGRGCLAGPVVAAAVILPENFKHPLLNDSKQVSEKHREILRPIIEVEAIAWAVAEVSVAEIEAINILRASFLAMHRAIEKLKQKPEFLIIDGNRFSKFENIPHACIIGGDAKFKSIAAASILAKTHRDAYMNQLHDQFPDYNWIANKGYGTEAHRNAIIKFGATIHHRKTFRLVPDQLELKFS